MSVIDENWWTRFETSAVHSLRLEESDGYRGPIIAEFLEGEDLALSGKRATLAACAPEMARMLLGRAVYSPSSIPGVDNGCDWCDCIKDDIMGQHRDDCPWLALMKKAGLK